MAENKVSMIIGLFVLIMLGLVFAGILSDTTSEADRVRAYTNNSVVFVSGSALLPNANLRSLENYITSGVLMNNFTNNTIGSNNFIISANGSVQLRAGMQGATAQGASPTLNMSGTYYSEGYVKGDTTSRTITTQLVGLIFILGVFLFVLVKSGVLDMDELLGKK